MHGNRLIPDAFRKIQGQFGPTFARGVVLVGVNDKLREFGWNISKTADVIDTPRSNLYKKLEQYNIKQELDG